MAAPINNDAPVSHSEDTTTYVLFDVHYTDDSKSAVDGFVLGELDVTDVRHVSPVATSTNPISKQPAKDISVVMTNMTTPITRLVACNTKWVIDPSIKLNKSCLEFYKKKTLVADLSDTIHSTVGLPMKVTDIGALPISFIANPAFHMCVDVAPLSEKFSVQETLLPKDPVGGVNNFHPYQVVDWSLNSASPDDTSKVFDLVKPYLNTIPLNKIHIAPVYDCQDVDLSELLIDDHDKTMSKQKWDLVQSRPSVVSRVTPPMSCQDVSHLTWAFNDHQYPLAMEAYQWKHHDGELDKDLSTVFVTSVPFVIDEYNRLPIFWGTETLLAWKKFMDQAGTTELNIFAFNDLVNQHDFPIYSQYYRDSLNTTSKATRTAWAEFTDHIENTHTKNVIPNPKGIPAPKDTILNSAFTLLTFTHPFDSNITVRIFTYNNRCEFAKGCPEFLRAVTAYMSTLKTPCLNGSDVTNIVCDPIGGERALVFAASLLTQEYNITVNASTEFTPECVTLMQTIFNSLMYNRMATSKGFIFSNDIIPSNSHLFELEHYRHKDTAKLRKTPFAVEHPGLSVSDLKNSLINSWHAKDNDAPIKAATPEDIAKSNVTEAARKMLLTDEPVQSAPGQKTREQAAAMIMGDTIKSKAKVNSKTKRAIQNMMNA